MTRRQRTMRVRLRADHILSHGPSARAYATHFETQMRPGRAHGLLIALSLRLIRARTSVAKHLPGICRRPSSVKPAVR
jgi:hypothetical protein